MLPLTAVPANISLATVANVASSHASNVGTLANAWLNVTLNTFWAELALPAPTTFDGTLMTAS
jgi:hypothetical protein